MPAFHPGRLLRVNVHGQGPCAVKKRRCRVRELFERARNDRITSVRPR